MTASIPGDQDIGSPGSGDGWLTALAVHRGSFLPLHRQIHDLVRQEIDAGRLPLEPAASEGALAEQWGVSLAPVRQALMHLAARATSTGVGGEEPSSASRSSRRRSRPCPALPGATPSMSTVWSERRFTRASCRGGRRLQAEGGGPAGSRRSSASPAWRRARWRCCSPTWIRRASPASNRRAGWRDLYRKGDTVDGIELARAESVIEAVHATDEQAARARQHDRGKPAEPPPPMIGNSRAGRQSPQSSDNYTGWLLGPAPGRTTVMSVAAKSSPVHSTGYPVRSASAYVKQSPKLSPAGCRPLPYRRQPLIARSARSASTGTMSTFALRRNRSTTSCPAGRSRASMTMPSSTRWRLASAGRGHPQGRRRVLRHPARRG